MARQQPIKKTSSKMRIGVEAAEIVRRWIVGGRYQPGDRLPHQRDLATRFGVSFVTVQRALDSLRRDGFVQPRGSLGTFVSDTPPHLSSIALVFQDSSASWELPWSGFNQAMITSTQKPFGSVQVRAYFGITGHEDNEDTQRLIDDMRACRIGGLIFASAPHKLIGSPLLEEPDIPRVSVSNIFEGYDFPCIYPNHDAFLEKAVRHLARLGRKRLAVLWPAVWPTAPFDPRSLKMIKIVESVAAKTNMTIRPWWLQGISAQSPGWAQNCMRAVFHDGQNERPDCLIVTDDNLVEYAVAGLIAAGVALPRDVDVIGHANFPNPPRPAAAVTLLGFDARILMTTCVELLSAQRRGKPFPRHTLLPPLLEGESVLANQNKESRP
jgi:DNA-binding LacI/PurR family transcriptional regulator